MDRIEEIRKKYAPGTFLLISTDTVENAYRDVRFLLSHISSLEKRLEAQGKVVAAAKLLSTVPWPTELANLKNALREVE